jgi:hypothetical protein
VLPTARNEKPESIGLPFTPQVKTSVIFIAMMLRLTVTPPAPKGVAWTPGDALKGDRRNRRKRNAGIGSKIRCDLPPFVPAC